MAFVVDASQFTFGEGVGVYVSGVSGAVSVLYVASFGFPVGSQALVLSSDGYDGELRGTDELFHFATVVQWSVRHAESSFVQVVLAHFGHVLPGAVVVVEVAPQWLYISVFAFRVVFCSFLWYQMC